MLKDSHNQIICSDMFLSYLFFFFSCFLFNRLLSLIIVPTARLPISTHSLVLLYFVICIMIRDHRQVLELLLNGNL